MQPWVDNRGIENGSNRVESEKKNTGKKRPAMAIGLGFIIENFFV